MRSHDIRNDYFDWLYDIVCDNKPNDTTSYSKLLMHLHTIEFTWVLPMDENRASCGKDMRYRFAIHHNDLGSVDEILDILDKPCSVFEMMVALAVKMEEDIMDDPEYGDRIGYWFWGMIISLGLGSMWDANFDKKYVNEIIDKFLNRDYMPDGSGGLFTIRDCDCDLREVEIFHQMCWYLNSFM